MRECDLLLLFWSMRFVVCVPGLTLNRLRHICFLRTGYTGDKKAVCMEATALKKNQEKNRSRIRLAKCDIDNPLQRFFWNVNMKDQGQIQLESRKDLCLTWSGGANVEPGQTPVVVMPCDKVEKGPRSKGWSIC
jgi:hypothetical protein